MSVKTHGLLWNKELLDQQDTDFLAGTVPENIAEIPQADRDFYLPRGEVQRAAEDTQACTSFSPSGGWKAMLQYLWDRELLTPDNKIFFKQYIKDGKINCAELFPAILSDTTKQGNSLKAPLQAIHEYGMIPEDMLPLESWMTWEDAHNPKRITQTMRDLGDECAKRLVFNYERVYKNDFATWLVKGLITVGGFAWPFPDANGVHQKTNNPFNHAFLLWDLPKYEAFDSYPDTFDGDFTKKLAPDYEFTDYGYRVLFSKQGNPEIEDIVAKVRATLMAYGLSKFFADFLARFYKQLKGIWKN